MPNIIHPTPEALKSGDGVPEIIGTGKETIGSLVTCTKYKQNLLHI